VVNETSVSSVLGEVRKVGKAVGAFTYYNLEELEAVVRAAETPRAPTIVLVSPCSFGAPGARGSSAASRPRSPPPRRTF
jgi:fructose/tagatose bisphosphate aldolase